MTKLEVLVAIPEHCVNCPFRTVDQIGCAANKLAKMHDSDGKLFVTFEGRRSIVGSASSKQVDEDSAMGLASAELMGLMDECTGSKSENPKGVTFFPKSLQRLPKK